MNTFHNQSTRSKFKHAPILYIDTKVTSVYIMYIRYLLYELQRGELTEYHYIQRIE